jgi:hypothetical protein
MQPLELYDFSRTAGFQVLESQTSVPGKVSQSRRHVQGRDCLWIEYEPGGTGTGARDDSDELAAGNAIVMLLPSASVAGEPDQVSLEVTADVGAASVSIQAVDAAGVTADVELGRIGPQQPGVLRARLGSPFAPSTLLPRLAPPLRFARIRFTLAEPKRPLRCGLFSLSISGAVRLAASGLAAD